MGFLVPAVKIADDINFFGIRGPDGEVNAWGSLSLQVMAPELFVETEMIAFIKDEEVVGGQQGDIRADGTDRVLTFLLALGKVRGILFFHAASEP